MELTAKIVAEKHLTTLMVTHNLRHALTYGDRLLMLHAGQVVLDRSGEEKQATQLDVFWVCSTPSASNAETNDIVQLVDIIDSKKVGGQMCLLFNMYCLRNAYNPI